MRRSAKLAQRRRAARFVAPAEPDAELERKLSKYVNKARANMERFDRLSPYQRALVNYFGADVLARISQNIAPEDIPKRLGKAKEFAEYWEQFQAPAVAAAVAAAKAEKERIASAWSDF
jgi:uncharacterized protein YigA (DUF484 family)